MSDFRAGGSPPERVPASAFIIAAAVAVIVLLLGWLVHVRLKTQAGSDLVRAEQTAVTEQKLLLRSELNDISGFVAMLGQMASTRLQPAPETGFEPQVRAEFLAFAKARGLFDRIRLLDAEGREVVDIKRIRSKNASDYFRDTTSGKRPDVSAEPWAADVLGLPAGHIFIALPRAEADEKGDGQILRAGMALRSERSARPAGYVVTDYRAQGLFDAIARGDARFGIVTQVIDAGGDWLRGMGARSGGRSLAQTHPEIWEKISSTVAGTLRGKDGLVVFDTVNLAGTDLPVGVSGLGQAWRILSWKSPQAIATAQWLATKDVWWWTVLGVAFFVPLTWMLARDRARNRALALSREQAHSLLQSITDSSIDGIVAGEAVRDARGDVRDFRLIFSNPAASHILQTFQCGGNSGEDREFPLFFSPDFFARCVQVVATGTRYETEQSADSESLGRRWFRIVAIKLEDGLLLSVADITQQKFAVHELQRAKDSAEVANRAKTQFLTMMGHEIRTPMNGLLGFAALLEGTSLTEEQREYVSTLRLSGEALLRILEDILDYSHMEFEALNIKSVPVDVRELVAQVSRLFVMALSNRNLKLVTRVAPDVPEQVLGDDVRLRQILLNLVGNAVKFTTEGFIVLDVSRDVSRPDHFLVFHITDSGTGVPPEMVDRLFKPFSQVDSNINRRFGGTGLGLSICKRLVETMGGEIGVHTAANRGSDFYFSLPIRRPEFPASEGESHPAPLRLHADQPRILVVDDDSVNRKLILRMIEKIGARVEVVASGEEALAAVRESEFDLILMDVQMPGMDGLETTRKIREIEGASGRHTPISAVTANSAAGDRDQCFEAGMDDYLCKPIRLEALEDLIDRHLAK